MVAFVFVSVSVLRVIGVVLIAIREQLTVELVWDTSLAPQGLFGRTLEDRT